MNQTNNQVCLHLHLTLLAVAASAGHPMLMRHNELQNSKNGGDVHKCLFDECFLKSAFGCLVFTYFGMYSLFVVEIENQSASCISIRIIECSGSKERIKICANLAWIEQSA